MEDGVSKAEFPLPTNYYKLVIGTFAAFLLNVISRSFSTLQRNNLVKCHSAFRYCHRLHASELKSCASLATLWEIKPHQGVFSRQMRSGVYKNPDESQIFAGVGIYINPLSRKIECLLLCDYLAITTTKILSF